MPKMIWPKLFNQFYMDMSNKTTVEQYKELRVRTYKNMEEEKRTYIKIPPDNKQELFRLVMKEGKKIKEAARIVSIKYATAKTLVFQQRMKKKQARLNKEEPKRSCCVTELNYAKESHIWLLCTLSEDPISHNLIRYKSQP
ncbi:hypothetical protein pb186bvf_009495 [Paramecium bursaria]